MSSKTPEPTPSATIAKMPKCGLIMPISLIDGCTEGHWEEVRGIIKEALSETEFSVELVSDSNEIGVIQKRIVQNIYDNEMVICDVSAKNPNVMFELGMRLAFDKPTIIIKDNKTNYSFDTAPIEHIEYPRDLHYHTIQAFKLKLKEKVIATYAASKRPDYTTFLKHFGQFVVAKIDEKKIGKEDFILQSLAEMQHELRATRMVAERNSYLTNERFHSRPERVMPMDEFDFIIKFINSRNGAVNLMELKNSESPLFKEMLNEYTTNHVPPSIAMKDRHVISITKNLINAASKLG